MARGARTWFTALLFVAIAVVAGIAALALLPFLKEGASLSEAPVFAAVAAGLLAIAYVWWRIVGRSRRKSLAVWLILGLPATGHLALAATLAHGYWQGQRIASAAKIENFREAFIEWSGFNGPVGLSITFDLVHPGDIDGLIEPPEIRMAPIVDVPRAQIAVTRTAGSGYFNGSYLSPDIPAFALLKTVLQQRRHPGPSAGSPRYDWTAADRFDAAGRTRLTYRLLPGSIDVADGDFICLGSTTYGIPACGEDMQPAQGCAASGRRRATEMVYGDGSDLTALWAAFGGSDMIVDLSQLLTGVLRRNSVLQGDAGMWTAMQRRLEPDGLTAAGYALCPPGPDSHTDFRTCFCRP